MKKNLTIYLIIGFILSAVALYLAFRNVPFAELVAYFGAIDYLWILPAIAMVLASFVLRVVRWQIILETSRKIRFWHAYHPLMIGFMMNCILPGRVGEIARPAILRHRERIPFATGLATVAAERILDMSLLVIFFIATFSVIHISSDLHVPFGDHDLNRTTLDRIFHGMVQVAIAFIAAVVLISIPKTRKFISSMILALPSLFFFAGNHRKAAIRRKICQPLISMVENAALGLALIKHPRKLVLCFIFSLFIWGLQALSYYTLSRGSPGIDLTPPQLSAVMVIICFFIALPSVPGFWGLWEAGGMFALALFGVSSRDAAGFTLANHAVQMFPVIIMGLVSAMIISVNIWQLTYQRENQHEKIQSKKSEN